MTYVLQTGEAGGERLALVEKVYGDHTRRILGRLGVHEGAKVADLGCGTGSTTKWFSSLVGPAGEVVAVDESGCGWPCSPRTSIAAASVTSARYRLTLRAQGSIVAASTSSIAGS